MADLEIHRAYKTAKNMTHYDWEWVDLETDSENEDTQRTTGTGRIPVQVPVEYIKFVSPGGLKTYMPMSELLSAGLGGLTFGTARQAIIIQRAAN